MGVFNFYHHAGKWYITIYLHTAVSTRFVITEGKTMVELPRIATISGNVQDVTAGFHNVNPGLRKAAA